MNSRVSGHALRSEGKPYNEQGKRLSREAAAKGGRALCSCGWLSGALPSDNMRKALHRAHKDAIQQGNAS